MNDAKIAAIARRLAIALSEAAYERSSEAKKAVTLLHVELMRAVAAEDDEPDYLIADLVAP
jgi:hypothetical protein